MALDCRLSTSACNEKADAIAALLDDGYLRLYDGSRPATPDDPITTQTLLVELRFDTPAFGAAVDGMITANPLASDVALATGDATFYRTYQSDGTTVVTEGTVGTSDANMIVNNTAVQINLVVEIETFTHTEPAEQ